MKAIYKTTSAVFIFLILFNFITCSSQTPALKEKSCPPCQIIASKTLSNKGTGKWPSINGGKALKINALTSLQYDRGASNLNLYYQDEFTPQGFEKFEFVIESWWMNPGLDPWSKEPYWGDEYLQPIHHFEECVDDNLRWMCGYSYIVDIPENYSKDKKYPLVIYLHGSVVSKTQSFVKRDTTRNIFYRPKSDPYVYAAPIKLEIDWDSKKLEDMIENIKENLNIDPERIYLTGLSMGGRGAFIIASELSNTFAAIMPLSPHHGPYSYLPLAKKVKNIPIWMSHGDIDQTASYLMAKKMADTLSGYGAKISFRTEKNIGHWGWDNIYKDSIVIDWLLSWRKNN